MARVVRQAAGFSPEAPISNERLGELLSLQPEIFASASREFSEAPLSLAIHRWRGDRLSLYFRRSRVTGRRFEASRWIADHFWASPGDHWLPAAETRTARQQFQRAFAAEFLCPIEALRDLLGDDLSEERLEESRDHFIVSPLMVRSHLANHGTIV
ncbi:MAG: hypothetical protein HQL51_07670 [Magnetococcales bacterium]|nr:hypothetical protein [Magnetococcales bacterium]